MSVDTHLLTGAYATHSLPNSEEPSFEQHLVECAACRTEVQELEATAARMGSSLTGAAPYGMRARVLAEVGRTRQLPPREPAPALRFRWHPSVLAVAASVVLLIAVVVVNASLRNQVNEAAEQRQAIERILTAPDVTVTSATGSSGVSGRVVVAPSQESGCLLRQRTGGGTIGFDVPGMADRCGWRHPLGRTVRPQRGRHGGAAADRRSRYST